MAKTSNKVLIGALVALIVGVVAALMAETSRNPSFRAEDYDSLEACLANIPSEWASGGVERTGAETACHRLLASAPSSSGSVQEPAHVSAEDLHATLSVLAHDSLMGRATGTEGARSAARFIAAEMERHGLEPAGDDGYLQRVPFARQEATGRRPLELLPSWDEYEALPEAERVTDANVIGVLPGADPELRDEAIVIAAHFDHLGVGQPDASGDSIYNGADDDASGVAALLEIARALAEGPAPARTLVFMAATAEELGMLGTLWYLEHPVVPLEETVGMLAIEMIGRPDSLAGGPGRAWLTGYERSTMGDVLRDNGIPIVPDPRPEQNFFLRSDNAPFAFRGIPAHTLSSYGLHEDYHRPSDTIETIDFEHMATVTQATIDAVRILADGPTPEWHPGGEPKRRRE